MLNQLIIQYKSNPDPQNIELQNQILELLEPLINRVITKYSPEVREALRTEAVKFIFEEILGKSLITGKPKRSKRRFDPDRGSFDAYIAKFLSQYIRTVAARLNRSAKLVQIEPTEHVDDTADPVELLQRREQVSNLIEHMQQVLTLSEWNVFEQLLLGSDSKHIQQYLEISSTKYATIIRNIRKKAPFSQN